MDEFALMERDRTPDGAGGYINNWREGMRFFAACVMDTTMQSRIAEKQGVSSVYTITTDKAMRLEYHDVIKRISDGRTFRVTSVADDKVSPKVSGLSMAQVTAERWELPS